MATVIAHDKMKEVEFENCVDPNFVFQIFFPDRGNPGFASLILYDYCCKISDTESQLSQSGV